MNGTDESGRTIREQLEGATWPEIREDLELFSGPNDEQIYAVFEKIPPVEMMRQVVARDFLVQTFAPDQWTEAIETTLFENVVANSYWPEESVTHGYWREATPDELESEPDLAWRLTHSQHPDAKRITCVWA